MAEDNLSAPAEPVATTPPSEEELISDISNLLEPLETDRPEEPEEARAAEPAEDDDPLGMNDAEDVESEDDNADPDDPSDPEVKGGRFAPDTAKVQFNGETISIADLKGRVDKRVKEFQRGFTEKTQALSTRETEVDQYAQSLDQFREYATWYAETHLPKQPEAFAGDARTDPQGFLEWQQRMGEWQTHVNAYQTFQQQKQQDGQRQAGETQKQHQDRIARERDALLNAIPVLKDQVKGPKVWNALVEGAVQHFGYTPEEVGNFADHRGIVVLREALAYRRIKDAAPKVQAEVRKPVVNTGRRAPTSQVAVKERQARTERLRNSGSIDDAAAAIADLL